jgi:uncharacterized protein (DUF1697 family)
MTVWVALLRAVNVSGVNRLPMADLRKTLAAQGLSGVKTYIQSGSVVFRSGEPAHVLGPMIADTIHAGFGFRPPVLILSREQVLAALAANHKRLPSRPRCISSLWSGRCPRRGWPF